MDLEDLDQANELRERFARHVADVVAPLLVPIVEAAKLHETADQTRHVDVLRAIEAIVRDPPTAIRPAPDDATPSAILARSSAGAISRLSRAAVAVPWPVWVVLSGTVAGVPALVEYGFGALAAASGAPVGGP